MKGWKWGGEEGQQDQIQIWWEVVEECWEVGGTCGNGICRKLSQVSSGTPLSSVPLLGWHSDGTLLSRAPLLTWHHHPPWSHHTSNIWFIYNDFILFTSPYHCGIYILSLLSFPISPFLSRYSIRLLSQFVYLLSLPPCRCGIYCLSFPFQVLRTEHRMHISFLLHVKVIGVALCPVGTCLYCCLFILRRLVF
jgi:hypothetical protein